MYALTTSARSFTVASGQSFYTGDTIRNYYNAFGELGIVSTESHMLLNYLVNTSQLSKSSSKLMSDNNS